MLVVGRLVSGEQFVGNEVDSEFKKCLMLQIQNDKERGLGIGFMPLISNELIQDNYNSVIDINLPKEKVLFSYPLKIVYKEIADVIEKRYIEITKTIIID